jgi:hypothetical protein
MCQIYMKINKINLDENHWTSDYIPISEMNISTKKQKNHSITFYWTDKYKLQALCRAYYIDKNEIQISDLWLNEKLRGKQIKGIKISVLFMRKIIQKIWTHFENHTKLSLLVHKENIGAIKLYNKLKFNIVDKKINMKNFKMKNGLKMIRNKK